jgi:hypothetical protein
MLINFSSFEYPKSKLVILALLALNAVIYALVDTLISAADAIVWLVLLVIYELESTGIELPIPEAGMRIIRDILIAIIVLVFFGYLLGGELLDAVNALLWFGLIAMLEIEVRWPELARQYARTFWVTTLVIFLGLIAMAGLWLWQQAWLDAYDAILWIVAFGFIEVDIFHFLQRKQADN